MNKPAILASTWLSFSQPMSEASTGILPPIGSAFGQGVAVGAAFRLEWSRVDFLSAMDRRAESSGGGSLVFARWSNDQCVGGSSMADDLTYPSSLASAG